MLSDFIADDYEQTLKIVSKKHDITGIRVYDKHEETIPNLGLVQMKDEETGQVKIVNTASKKVRNNYATFHKEKTQYFEESFRKSGSGILSTRVDESYVKKLLSYFKNRG